MAFDRVWPEALIFKLRFYGYQILCYISSIVFFLQKLQRVLLNGQASEKCKRASLKADGTSLFSFRRDPNERSEKLDGDLGKVARWAYQWKLSFSPDSFKQAMEVHFSRKINPVDTHIQLF